MPPSSATIIMTASPTPSKAECSVTKPSSPLPVQRAHAHLCVKQGHCRDRKQCFEHLNDMYQMIKSVPNYLTQLKTAECNTLQEGDILFLQANLENGKNSCGKEGACCHCDYIRSIDPSTQEFKRLLKRVRDFWKKRKSEQQRNSETRKQPSLIRTGSSLEQGHQSPFGSTLPTSLSMMSALTAAQHQGGGLGSNLYDMPYPGNQNLGLGLNSLVNQNIQDQSLYASALQDNSQQLLSVAQQYHAHLQQQTELQSLEKERMQQIQNAAVFQQLNSLAGPNHNRQQLGLQQLQQQLNDVKAAESTSQHQALLELLARENLALKQEVSTLANTVTQLRAQNASLTSQLQGSGLLHRAQHNSSTSPLLASLTRSTEIRNALHNTGAHASTHHQQFHQLQQQQQLQKHFHRGATSTSPPLAVTATGGTQDQTSTAKPPSPSAITSAIQQHLQSQHQMLLNSSPQVTPALLNASRKRPVPSTSATTASDSDPGQTTPPTKVRAIEPTPEKGPIATAAAVDIGATNTTMPATTVKKQ